MATGLQAQCLARSVAPGSQAGPGSGDKVMAGKNDQGVPKSGCESGQMKDWSTATQALGTVWTSPDNGL